MIKFERRINYLLHLKYRTNERLYNINIIDNIIYNEKSHLVSEFKDFLISEDEYEVLKRFYNKEEAKIRINKFLIYYNKYSLLFPNYSMLPESSIIYKNINLKQKIIDDIQRNNKVKEIKSNDKDNSDTLVFNSKVYDSIIKDNENCLSIFSIDKESNCNDNKEDEINDLIEKIDFNFKNNKKAIPPKENNMLFKSLNLNIDISDINNINGKINNKVIYTRKRTPNNSINSKFFVKSCSNLTKNLKNQFKNEKKGVNIDKNNHMLNKGSGSFIINNKKKKIYKKINLNFLDNSIKIHTHTSASIRDLTKRNSIINTPITHKTTNQNSMFTTNFKEKNREKKINDIPIKINLLKEKIELNRIKVNKKNIKSGLDLKKINQKNLIINDISNKIKDSNNYLYKKNYNKSNDIINTNLTDRNIKKNSNTNNANNQHMKKIINLLNSFEKINSNRNNSENNIKENNKNKNKVKFSDKLKYIINSYNTKTTTYNTSIQFNNNNINIINSNNNPHNILKNIYGFINFNQSNDINDFVQNSPYEKKIISENKSYNVLKNNNKTDILNYKNYFSSLNK